MRSAWSVAWSAATFAAATFELGGDDVELLARRRALGQELLDPAHVGLGAGERRQVLGQHRLVAGDLGLDLAVVDAEQHVAGLDDLAVPDLLLDDLPIDAGPHRHSRVRLDPADARAGDRKVDALGDGGHDGDAGRLALVPAAPLPGAGGGRRHGIRIGRVGGLATGEASHRRRRLRPGGIEIAVVVGVNPVGEPRDGGEEQDEGDDTLHAKAPEVSAGAARRDRASAARKPLMKRSATASESS